MKKILFIILSFLSFLNVQTISADPIPISSISELQKIGYDPAYPLDGEYYLTCDIDASDTKNWNGGKGFKPIGYYDENEDPFPFEGKFDGKGNTINNL